MILEVFCFWLYFRYNRYYNAYFFNSSNRLAGNIQSFASNSGEYFELTEINAELARENAVLRQMLSNQNLEEIPADTALKAQFRIMPAEVINNTVSRSSNYLTLNKGAEDGIKPEMGVISGNGVVGQIKSVSARFSTVISLLHQKMLVSGQMKSSGTLCTVQWDALNPKEAELKYIPRHINLSVGDSIITSGYNAIFPEDILIGVVSEWTLPKESAFYNAKIRLSVDFQSLEYVYVVENTIKQEKDSLEALNE